MVWAVWCVLSPRTSLTFLLRSILRTPTLSLNHHPRVSESPASLPQIPRTSVCFFPLPRDLRSLGMVYPLPPPPWFSCCAAPRDLPTLSLNHRPRPRVPRTSVCFMIFCSPFPLIPPIHCILSRHQYSDIPPALFLSGLFRSSNQVLWPQPAEANIARAVRNTWPLAPLLLEPSRSTSDLTYS